MAAAVVLLIAIFEANEVTSFRGVSPKRPSNWWDKLRRFPTINRDPTEGPMRQISVVSDFFCT